MWSCLTLFLPNRLFLDPVQNLNLFYALFLHLSSSCGNEASIGNDEQASLLSQRMEVEILNLMKNNKGIMNRVLEGQGYSKRIKRKVLLKEKLLDEG